MKQARRKELKTNELSIYLQQIRDAATRHANYIFGGVVVVVVVLVIGLYVRHNRHAVEAARWSEYEQIQQAAAQGKADALDRAASLVNDAGADSRLGPRAAELYAGLAFDKAMRISPLGGSSERAALLEKARDGYQKLIDTYGDRPAVVARARLGLAAVAETLCVDGRGDAEAAGEQYRKIVDAGVAPYADLAKQQLDTLAERTRKLQIVATRPAEPPSTAPATLPASGSPQAETAPAVASEAPASAPAQATQP
ncbi:MAG: hypothetical protein HY718_03380 [Planctomycetes bacterium]|nr:hypothetical protein [Planctomycetota bacterium]